MRAIDSIQHPAVSLKFRRYFPCRQGYNIQYIYCIIKGVKVFYLVRGSENYFRLQPHLVLFPQAGPFHVPGPSGSGRGQQAASRFCGIQRRNTLSLTPQSTAMWFMGFSRFSAGAAASALNSRVYTRRSVPFFPSSTPCLLYSMLIFMSSR